MNPSNTQQHQQQVQVQQQVQQHDNIANPQPPNTSPDDVYTLLTNDQNHIAEARRKMNALLQTQLRAREELRAGEENLSVASQRVEHARQNIEMTDGAVSRGTEELTDALLQEPTHWNAMYRKMVEYKEKHGNVDVKRNPLKSEREANPEIVKLGSWVGRVRLEARRPPGHPEHIEPYKVIALNRLGFNWEPRENYWMEKYEELRQYMKAHGKHKMPTRKEPLGVWCDGQVLEYNKFHSGIKPCYITKERIDMLNDIGFVWDRMGTAWKDSFEELKKYREANGHCHVPVNYGDKTLFRWIAKQRKKYKNYREGKKPSLTDEQVQLLQDIDFFEPSEDRLAKFHAQQEKCAKKERSASSSGGCGGSGARAKAKGRGRPKSKTLIPQEAHAAMVQQVGGGLTVVPPYMFAPMMGMPMHPAAIAGMAPGMPPGMTPGMPPVMPPGMVGIPPHLLGIAMVNETKIMKGEPPIEEPITDGEINNVEDEKEETKFEEEADMHMDEEGKIVAMNNVDETKEPEHVVEGELKEDPQVVLPDKEENVGHSDIDIAVAPLEVDIIAVPSIDGAVVAPIVKDPIPVPMVEEIVAAAPTDQDILAAAPMTEELVAATPMSATLMINEDVEFKETIPAPVVTEFEGAQNFDESVPAPVVTEFEGAQNFDESVPAPVATEFEEARKFDEPVPAPVATEFEEARKFDEPVPAPMVTEFQGAPKFDEPIPAPAVAALDVEAVSTVNALANTPMTAALVNTPMVPELSNAPMVNERVHAPMVSELSNAPIGDELAEAPMVNELVNAAIVDELVNVPMVNELTNASMVDEPTDPLLVVEPHRTFKHEDVGKMDDDFEVGI